MKKNDNKKYSVEDFLFTFGLFLPPLQEPTACFKAE